MCRKTRRRSEHNAKIARCENMPAACCGAESWPCVLAFLLFALHLIWRRLHSQAADPHTDLIRLSTLPASSSTFGTFSRDSPQLRVCILESESDFDVEN